MRRLVILLAVVTGAVWTVEVAPAAHASFASSHYTWTDYQKCLDGDSTNWADPISLIFYNQATEVLVTNHVRFHVPNMGGDGGATGQWFRSHDHCTRSDDGSADGGGHDDRYHIRIQRTFESDNDLGITTVGTPHYEYWDYLCGSSGLGMHFVAGNNPHPPGGFNKARNYIGDKMYAGNHTVITAALYWGNTAHRHQCGGHPDAWLDGYVDEIRIPSESH